MELIKIQVNSLKIINFKMIIGYSVFLDFKRLKDLLIIFLNKDFNYIWEYSIISCETLYIIK